MRKVALIVILLGLLFNTSVQAETLSFAAELDMNKQLERYSSYTIDESTGDWSAHGLYAQQLISFAGQNDINDLMSGGVCIIYPGMRGNRKSSLMEPVLYVCLLRSNAINAQALSIATGGVRYDFACEATAINLNDRHDRQGEQFILPLSEDGMALLRSFADNGGEVRIVGEKQIFRTSVVNAREAKNARQRFEAMSLPAISEFLTIWPANYALWDLNAAYWSSDRAKMAAVALETSDYPTEWPALEKGTMCLDAKNGAAVKAYQQLLKDNAFFTATPDSNFGKITIRSTRHAQQYFGLIPTGMADRALIEALKGVQQANADIPPSDVLISLSDDVQLALPKAEYVLENQLSIRLDRLWSAHTVSPTNPLDPMELREPADRSNSLLAADGGITNLSGISMDIASAIQASMQVNGIPYVCVVQCERDEGSAFGSALLPMGKSRLVLFCEIPAGIEITSIELEIDVTAGSEQYSLCYDF